MSLFLFLAKLKQLKQIVQNLEQKFFTKSKIRYLISLLSLLFELVLIIHLFTCVWIFLSFQEHFYESENLTWLETVLPNCKLGISIYVKGFYFITLTMVTVGYGDITPQTNLEMLFSILTMLFSCGVFGYSVNQIGAILSEMNKQEKDLAQNLTIIKKYMEKKNISSHLQNNVGAYLQFYLTERLNHNI